MIQARLNDNYGNDFLTTQSGQIFYKKGNRLEKPAGFQEVDMRNLEIVGLINQGILTVGADSIKTVEDVVKISEEELKTSAKVLEDPEIEVSDEVSPEDKMESKPTIVKDNLFDESIKEVKTMTNDRTIKGMSTQNNN